MIFPSGDRYEVTGKVLTGVGTVRIEGHKWTEENRGKPVGRGTRPAKARFTIDTGEIVPIIRLAQE